MKILLVTQYFWPESFRINDLAEELFKRGNEVTVLTGKPNYPEGHLYSGYSFWGYKNEIYKGVNVIRVPLLPRGSASGLRLALNYLSFVFFSCIYILFQKNKYDVSLTFAISPITQVYAALLHKLLYRSKAYLWVQDLWPDSVLAAGKVHFRFIYYILSRMVKGIYNNVDGILIQSEAFYESIINKKAKFKSKVKYIPNWAEDLFVEKNCIDIRKYKEIIPNGFIVMFAGNIGEAQDFESIIKAAICTKENHNIKWVILGDGRKKKEVEHLVKEHQLENTIFLLGRYALEEMPNFFIHADVMLVSLKNEYIFSLTIPSKIQSYMAFGKPIVSMVDGIGNQVIEEADCGYIAQAGEYTKLASNLLMLSKLDKTILNKKGENGYRYYQSNFSKKRIVDSLIDVFQDW